MNEPCPRLAENVLPHKNLPQFPLSMVHYKIKNKGACHRKPGIEKLRKKYMDNPPERLTSADIRSMSSEALLDMDYFLNDEELDDGFGEDGFYLF